MSNENFQKDKTVLVSMISGLFSGAIGKLITHPLDTIKAKIQVNTSSLASMRSVFTTTINQEGLKGLYKGLPVSVLGSIPGCIVYFGSYEYFKKHSLLIKSLSDSEFLMYFLGGIFAETLSCLIFVPVDVIKERMQVQSNLKTYNYKNDLDALFTILRQEKVRGLYKAYGATIMSFGPMSAFYFMFYEYLKGLFVRNDAKTYIQRVKNKDIDKLKDYKLNISFRESLLCSGLASAGACFITNPLDLVKLRMQVQRASTEYKSETSRYKNMIHGLFVIGYNEGFKGLFRGSFARAAHMTPTGAITMTMLEVFKPHVRKVLDE